MSEINFILKRPWQSITGIQEILYLGYNDENKIDCIPNRNKAKVMTCEECEEWLLVLANRNMWSIERFEEMTEEPEEIQEETQEENINEGN